MPTSESAAASEDTSMVRRPRYFGGPNSAALASTEGDILAADHVASNETALTACGLWARLRYGHAVTRPLRVDGSVRFPKRTAHTAPERHIASRHCRAIDAELRRNPVTSCRLPTPAYWLDCLRSSKQPTQAACNASYHAIIDTHPGRQYVPIGHIATPLSHRSHSYQTVTFHGSAFASDHIDNLSADIMLSHHHLGSAPHRLDVSGRPAESIINPSRESTSSICWGHTRRRNRHGLVYPEHGGFPLLFIRSIRAFDTTADLRCADV